MQLDSLINQTLKETVVVLIFIVILSWCITMAIRGLPHEVEEGKTGLLVDYWKWINTKPPDIVTNKPYPRYMTHDGLDTMLCPVCGAKFSSKDVKQLEYGYSIECNYCGTIIRSPRMRY